MSREDYEMDDQFDVMLEERQAEHDGVIAGMKGLHKVEVDRLQAEIESLQPPKSRDKCVDTRELEMQRLMNKSADELRAENVEREQELEKKAAVEIDLETAPPEQICKAIEFTLNMSVVWEFYTPDCVWLKLRPAVSNHIEETLKCSAMTCKVHPENAYFNDNKVFMVHVHTRI